MEYGGRTLNPAEKKYNTTQLESLALIEGVRKYKHYLQTNKFYIHTDHAAIPWIMKAANLKGKTCRWMSELIGLDFELIHRPGKDNAHADCLSRLPHTCVTSTPDYDPQRISRLQRNDPDLIELILYLESNIPYSKQVPEELSEENSGNFFTDRNNILYR